MIRFLDKQKEKIHQIFREESTVKQKKSRERLGAEFDRQVNLLIAAGFPAVVGLNLRAFLEYMNHARESACGLKCSMKYSLPFLVVPNLSAPLSDIAELILLGEKSGSSVYHEPVAILKEIWGPYLVTEVDDGSNIGTKDGFGEYVNLLKEDERQPLSTYEALILGILNPEIVKHHALSTETRRGAGYITLSFCSQRKCADLGLRYWSNHRCSYKWKVPSFKEREGGIRSNNLEAKVIITSLRNRSSMAM